MFRVWPRLIKRINGPRVWAHVDRSQRRPAIVIRQLSARRYEVTINYFTHLSELVPVMPGRYEADLLDQIADAMADLAFLNKHGTPDEGFKDPTHWRGEQSFGTVDAPA